MTEDVFDKTWVDDLDRFPGDVSGVPPEHKMLDNLHWNKNGLNGWSHQLWRQCQGDQADAVREWLVKHKPGSPPDGAIHACGGVISVT